MESGAQRERLGLASRSRPQWYVLAMLQSLLAWGCADVQGPTGSPGGDLAPSAGVSADKPVMAPPTPRSLPQAGDVVPGQYIVRFADDERDVPALARALAAQHGGQVRHEYTSALKGFAARLPEQSVEALRRNPRVVSVEADMVIRSSEVQSPPGSWGLDRIDQRQLPLDKRYDYGSDGSGVSVYILDTGIRTSHVEFGGRASGAYSVIQDGRGTNDCGGSTVCRAFSTKVMVSAVEYGACP